MGLFVKDNQGRSELQSKVASDLRERLKERDKVEAPEVEPQFNDDTHQTRTAGLVIGVLMSILFIAILVWALKLGGLL